MFPDPVALKRLMILAGLVLLFAVTTTVQGGMGSGLFRSSVKHLHNSVKNPHRLHETNDDDSDDAFL